jgi:predicted Zn-dependent protease with MMP-like domain
VPSPEVMESVHARIRSRMFSVSPERFGELASEALDSIPEGLARYMENVAVVVADRSEGHRLFGLYQGVPLTSRGNHYSGVAPDKITLYQEEISSVCSNEAELVAQIRKTVIHEVAHHFGIGDPRLKELGWA